MPDWFGFLFISDTMKFLTKSSGMWWNSITITVLGLRSLWEQEKRNLRHDIIGRTLMKTTQSRRVQDKQISGRQERLVTDKVALQ